MRKFFYRASSVLVLAFAITSHAAATPPLDAKEAFNERLGLFDLRKNFQKSRRDYFANLVNMIEKILDDKQEVKFKESYIKNLQTLIGIKNPNGIFGPLTSKKFLEMASILLRDYPESPAFSPVNHDKIANLLARQSPQSLWKYNEAYFSKPRLDLESSQEKIKVLKKAVSEAAEKCIESFSANHQEVIKDLSENIDFNDRYNPVSLLRELRELFKFECNSFISHLDEDEQNEILDKNVERWSGYVSQFIIEDNKGSQPTFPQQKTPNDLPFGENLPFPLPEPRLPAPFYDPWNSKRKLDI